MDGLDEDADLTFLLTTIRAKVPEPALAAPAVRVAPSRGDRPAGRGRTRAAPPVVRFGVDLRLVDIESAIERTAGVTASFIKELVRKAALPAALAEPGTGRLRVSDAHLTSALDTLLAENATLTRALLGLRPDESGLEVRRTVPT